MRYVRCLHTYFESVCVGLLESVTWAASSHRKCFENESQTIRRDVSEVYIPLQPFNEKISTQTSACVRTGYVGAWTVRQHKAKGISNMKVLCALFHNNVESDFSPWLDGAPLML